MKTIYLLFATSLVSLITLSSCGSKTESGQQAEDSESVNTEAPAKNDYIEKAEAAREAVKKELEADVKAWVENEAIDEHLSQEFRNVCNTTTYLPWFIMSEGNPYKLSVNSVHVEEYDPTRYMATVKKVLKYDGESPTPFTETYILTQQNGKWVIIDFLLDDGKSLTHEIKYNDYGQYL